MFNITPAREVQISSQLAQLSALFGAKRAVSQAALWPLYQLHDYPSLVREIRNSFGLDKLKVRIRYHEQLRTERTVAMVEQPASLPPVAAFAMLRPEVTLHLAMRRLYNASFANTVRALAHEMAHPLLLAHSHPLKESEFAVDLTAMLFGYHAIFSMAHSEGEVFGQYGLADIPGLSSLKSILMTELCEEEELTNSKYLTSEEVRFAAEIIRRCVL